MDEWGYKWVGEWMDNGKDGWLIWVDEWMCDNIDGWMDRWWMDGWKDVRWMGLSISGQMNGKYGRLDGWINNGWIYEYNEWTDG